MVHLPPGVNQFEFVIVSALRTAQLMRGCTPRVSAGNKPAVTAQREVAAGVVTRSPTPPTDVAP
jgi:DNA-directed RNA polymerase subunit K/omega